MEGEAEKTGKGAVSSKGGEDGMRQGEKRGTRVHRSRCRRVLRGCVILLGGTFFVVLALHGALRVFFPESRIRSILAGAVYRQTGRTFSVDRLSWSLVGRLEAEGIRVGFTPEEGPPDSLFFGLERLRIRFRLLPLFSRRLEVAEITLVHPRIRLAALPMRRSDTTVVQEKPSSPVASPPSAAPPQPLAWTLKLDRLSLEGVTVRIALPDTIRRPEIALSGLYMSVHDLVLPNGFPFHTGGAGGRVRMWTRAARLWIRDQQADFLFYPELALDWTLADSLWSGRVRLDLFRPDTREADVGLRLAIRGGGPLRWAGLDTCRLLLAGQTLLEASGGADMFQPLPRLKIGISSPGFPIEALVRLAGAYSPPEMVEVLRSFAFTGTWEALHGEIEGGPEALRFSLVSEFDGGGFQQGPLAAKGVAVSVFLSGRWNGSELSEGHGQAEVRVGEIREASDSTHPLTLRGISLTLTSRLDTAFFPAEGRVTARVGECLGGRLEFEADWRDARLSDLSTLSARLVAQIDSLILQTPPLPPFPLLGTVHGRLTGSAHGVSDLRFSLSVATQGLHFRPTPEASLEAIPDVSFDSSLECGLSSSLQTFTLRRGHWGIGAFLTGSLTGHFHFPRGDFSLESVTMLHNTAFPACLPVSLREAIEGVHPTGTETLRLRLTGGPGGLGSELALDAELLLDQINLQDPRGFAITGLGGHIRVHGTPAHLTGGGRINLGRVSHPLLFVPLEGASVEMTVAAEPPARIGPIRAVFTAPGLGLVAEATGRASISNSLIDLAGKIQFHMGSFGWNTPIQGVAVRGGIGGEVALETIDPRNQWVHLHGECGFEGLDLRVADALRVYRVQGRIPFSLDLDVNQGALLPDSRFRPIDPEVYPRTRAWLAGFTPAIDNVRVDSIWVAGYRLDDLVMDVDLRRGWIWIPFFRVSALDGRIGGSLWVALGHGNPSEIRYGIRGQASRINAGALLGKGGREETELNAHLDFTGRGIPQEGGKGIDLEGTFHITQIGPRFASTLLEGLDPRGNDRSIRLTRRLLNMGWRPRLFRFDLRHGHVYPVLELDQPWFAPIRIPERIEYGRLPFEMFLKMRLNQ